MQASRDAAAQQSRLEGGHIDRTLVRMVSASSGNDSRMKPLILQKYFAGGVKSADVQFICGVFSFTDRKSTRLNSSHQIISYAVFCLKKKKPGRRPSAEDSRNFGHPCTI